MKNTEKCIKNANFGLITSVFIRRKRNERTGRRERGHGARMESRTDREEGSFLVVFIVTIRKTFETM